jgi:hypothetical protein
VSSSSLPWGPQISYVWNNNCNKCVDLGCYSASSDDALLSPSNVDNAERISSGATDQKNETEPTDGTSHQNKVGQPFCCCVCKQLQFKQFGWLHVLWTNVKFVLPVSLNLRLLNYFYNPRLRNFPSVHYSNVVCFTLWGVPRKLW